MKDSATASSIRFQSFVFGLPFVVTLGTYALTMLNFVGPGNAAAWSAVMVGAGEPASASLSPLFRIILIVVGTLPSSWVEPHFVASWITILSMSTAVGFFALMLHPFLSKLTTYGAASYSMLAAILAGVASTVWANALTINPAPLALALVLTTGWLLNQINTTRSRILAFLILGFALTAHIAAAVFLPVMIWQSLRGQHEKARFVLAAFLLPMGLFLLPGMGPVFNLSSLFSQPTNIPDHLFGISLYGWSLWSALSPVAIVFVLLAIGVVVRGRHASITFALVLVPLTVCAFIPVFAEFSSIVAGYLIATLTITGIVIVFNRLPKGLGLILWIVVPSIWIWRGPDISRHGEDLWEIHATNVFTTQRYRTLIAITDHGRILAPARYIQEARDLRKDVLILDPKLLSDEKHLRCFNLDEYLKSQSGKIALASQREKFESGDSSELDSGTTDLFFALIDESLDSLGGGVLISSDIYLGPMIETIPEGLLWRVYDGVNYPYIFAGLDLGPIFPPTELERPLFNSTVTQYSEMFTNRAEYLMRDQLTSIAADYIRWAVKLNPQNQRARKIAADHGIHGEPLQLKPKEEPRSKHFGG
jgi:hypothetical protein